MRRSWGMQLLVSAKVFFEMAKGNYFLAKDLAKSLCIYDMYRVSTNVQKHVYQEGKATPNTWLLYLPFFAWYPVPGHFVNVSVNLKKRSNLSYRFIFRESLAKVLLKPWRKTAFIWRLGGLNCGLAKTSVQEVGPAVWAWKCQNWPMKVSKGPKYYAKRSNLNVQPPQKNYGGSFVRGPVRYSSDVLRKINMRFAKVWRK